MGTGGVLIWTLILIIAIVGIPFFIFRPILRKAGYSGWLSLSMFVPVVNVVLIWVFALVTWPNEKRPQSKAIFKGLPKNGASEHIYD